MSKPHSGQLIRSNALTRQGLILMVLIFLRKRGLDSCFLVEVNGLAAALKALW